MPDSVSIVVWAPTAQQVAFLLRADLGPADHHAQFRPVKHTKHSGQVSTAGDTYCITYLYTAMQVVRYDLHHRLNCCCGMALGEASLR